MATVVGASLVERHRGLDLFTGAIHTDLIPALHQVRTGLTDYDWAELHHHDDPAPPHPV